MKTTVYNPHELLQEGLLTGFVVRLQEYATIIKAIEKDKMENPAQHYIIQGLRGYGKTTLLLKLYYEIKNNVTLNNWLVPVIFKEEQNDITMLFKLWENI